MLSVAMRPLGRRLAALRTWRRGGRYVSMPSFGRWLILDSLLGVVEMSKVSGMDIECYHTWKLILKDKCGVTNDFLWSYHLERGIGGEHAGAWLNDATWRICVQKTYVFGIDNMITALYGCCHDPIGYRVTSSDFD